MATRTSPRLAVQKPALFPGSEGKENLTESSKSTAGGSRSQKVYFSMCLSTVRSRKLQHDLGELDAISQQFLRCKLFIRIWIPKCRNVGDELQQNNNVFVYLFCWYMRPKTLKNYT